MSRLYYFTKMLSFPDELIRLQIQSFKIIHKNRDTKVVVYELSDIMDKKYILKLSPKKEETNDIRNSDNDEIKIWKYLYEKNLAPEVVDYFYVGDIMFLISEKAGYSFDILYDSTDLIPINLRDDIISSVNKLHDIGIVHGDLGFQNILLSGTDILFIDFDRSFYINDMPEGRIEYLYEFLGINDEFEDTGEQIVISLDILIKREINGVTFF